MNQRHTYRLLGIAALLSPRLCLTSGGLRERKGNHELIDGTPMQFSIRRIVHKRRMEKGD
jgi:hypothetical protein